MSEMVRGLTIHNSWQGFFERATDIPAQTKIVSVDIFDTLLFRRVTPDVITRSVARELVRLLTNLGVSDFRDPVQERVAAFTEAACINAERGFDFGASLRQALPIWVRQTSRGRVHPDAQFFAYLEQFEVLLEKAATFSNYWMMRWLAAVKQSGHRVVLSTDMYLSSDQISSLLTCAGYPAFFDAIYVSGEVGYLKVTGHLFEFICQHECVEPDHILHVGDSLEADGTRAAHAGCLAHVVTDRAHDKYRLALKDEESYYFKCGSSAGLIAARWSRDDLPQGVSEARSHTRTIADEIGSDILGPIVSSFCHRVAERCRDLQVDRIYFLAREGHILKGAFDTIRGLVWPEGDGPPSTYLCVSRATTLLASVRCCDLRALSASTANHNRMTVRNIFGLFGIEPTLLIERAAAYGIMDIDTLLPSHYRDWPPFQKLTVDHILELEMASKHARSHELLKQYLTQEGWFSGGRVAIVDIGWNGQIQDNIVHAFQGEPGFPDVFGLYLGVRQESGTRYTSNSYSEGLVADERIMGWCGRAAFNFPQGLEEVLRAPHGTVVGYEPGTNCIRPVLRPNEDLGRQAELKDDSTIAVVQVGVLRYATHYKAAMSVWGSSAADTIQYARLCLDRILRYPTREIVDFFFSLSNVCDQGMNRVVALGDGLERFGLLGRFLRLKSTLGASLWKQGTLTRVLGERLRHAALIALAIQHAQTNSVETLSSPMEFSPSTKGPRKSAANSSPSNCDPSEDCYRAALSERLHLGRISSKKVVHPIRVNMQFVWASYLDCQVTGLLGHVVGKKRYHWDGIHPWNFSKYQTIQHSIQAPTRSPQRSQFGNPDTLVEALNSTSRYLDVMAGDRIHHLSANVEISIILPTYNGIRTLPKVLEALEFQQAAPAFEVIVIDDGSDEHSKSFLRRWRPSFPARICFREHIGPAGARNVGLNVARGKWILFIGDDTVPDEYLIRNHVDALTELRSQGFEPCVLGLIEWHGDLRVSPFMRYIREEGVQFGYGIMEDPDDLPFNYFYTSNVSCRRDFVGHQRFDTRFRYPAFEDTEFSYRLKTRGLQIKFAPNAIVYHHHLVDVNIFRKRQWKCGYSAVSFFEMHPELYWFLKLSSDGTMDEPHSASQKLDQLIGKISGYIPIGTPKLWERLLDHAYAHGVRQAWRDKRI